MQNEIEGDALLGDESAELSMSVEDRIQSIEYHMEKIYKEHRQMQLLYPWVAVMLVKKERTLESGIVLPEHQQNKVMHEGIVLETWRDKVVDRGVIHKNGERLTRCEVLHSELKPGDHVLFQHWAGQPIFDYDPQRFRLVRECDWHETKNGGIVAKVVYSDRNTKAVSQLMDLVDAESTLVPEYRKLLEAQLDDHFIVVDKNAEGLTLQGR